MKKYIDAELEIVEVDTLNTGLFNFSNPVNVDKEGQGDNDATLW